MQDPINLDLTFFANKTRMTEILTYYLNNEVSHLALDYIYANT